MYNQTLLQPGYIPQRVSVGKPLLIKRFCTCLNVPSGRYRYCVCGAAIFAPVPSNISFPRSGCTDYFYQLSEVMPVKERVVLFNSRTTDGLGTPSHQGLNPLVWGHIQACAEWLVDFGAFRLRLKCRSYLTGARRESASHNRWVSDIKGCRSRSYSWYSLDLDRK